MDMVAGNGSSSKEAEAPKLIEHIHRPVDYTPFEVKWVPESTRLVSLGVHASGKGALRVLEMRAGELLQRGQAEAAQGLKCGSFGASTLEERQLATGDHAGTLALWDLECLEKGPVLSLAGAHGGIINAMDGIGGQQEGKGPPELVTGSRDGCVRVWDLRVRHPVLSLEPREGEPARDCWAVGFGNSFSNADRCFCAGYDNGDLKLFDLRANAVRWEANAGNGVTGLEFDRRDIEMNTLAVTTLEASFKIYDMRTQHPTEGFACLSHKAHAGSTVWLARHTPQNRDLFVTCGGNGSLQLYKYHYPANRVTTAAAGGAAATSRSKEGKEEDANATGAPRGVPGSVELLQSQLISPQPVVALDWHPTREGLCALSALDQTLRIYLVTRLQFF